MSANVLQLESGSIVIMVDGTLGLLSMIAIVPQVIEYLELERNCRESNLKFSRHVSQSYDLVDYSDSMNHCLKPYDRVQHSPVELALANASRCSLKTNPTLLINYSAGTRAATA